MKVHRKLVALGAAVLLGAVAATVIASLASAQGPGAIENSTPGGAVKIKYTGGTVPSPYYSIIDRLTLPPVPGRSSPSPRSIPTGRRPASPAS